MKRDDIFYYGWIPNLSSSINFQYITDEINYDVKKTKITPINNDICNSSDTKKCFWFETNSSDQVNKKEKGKDYTAIIILEKQEDKTIYGTYRELLKEGEDFINATFEIRIDGFIELKEITTSNVKYKDDEAEKHKILGIYSNIKHVLHKDVHHSQKEDVELGIYLDKETYKYDILEALLLSIKSFERTIKDDSSPLEKINIFSGKIIKAEGYRAYLKTYAAILMSEVETEIIPLKGKISLLSKSISEDKNMITLREDYEKLVSLELKDRKIKRTLLLADNIIESAKSLLGQYKEEKGRREFFPKVILAAMTIFLPAAIFFFGLLPRDHKEIFSNTYESLFLSLSYTLIVIFVANYYTGKKLASVVYLFFASSFPLMFIKVRMRFGASAFMRRVSNIVLILMVIFGAFLILFSFPYTNKIILGILPYFK